MTPRQPEGLVAEAAARSRHPQQGCYGTGQHKRPGAVDRRDGTTSGASPKFRCHFGLARRTATMAPPAGSACISRARVATSFPRRPGRAPADVRGGESLDVVADDQVRAQSHDS
ncbi:hypothetical protein Srubr_81670 [Streptomyces rubradiris]|uniref:Uncharacterized protein n=1 Tax=Streptomyces rubradiris TaxID=285531 RepID=A0ABQ3RR14_STRRR|nr:hypothetical protein Srubr_81670 [Streptomyces rubradiris]